MMLNKYPVRAVRTLGTFLLLFCCTGLFAQVDTAWVRTYNGPGNGGDYAAAIAVDDEGNVCVAGYSATNTDWPYDFDYLTVKYDADGDTQWVRRYIGPGTTGNNDDYALALTVDGAGNVYVTGHSPGSTSGDDIATIKYLPNGDTAWVRRYNGAANDVDCGNAIALDGAGNVYVTGYSYDPVTSDDYLTIKYDPAGNVQWTITYNGSGGGGDYAKAMVVDDTGTVYITGNSFGGWPPSGMDDYATIKYTQSTAVAENGSRAAPDQLFLNPNYPNPFSGVTEISYGVPQKTTVNISVYNSMGQYVRTLVDDIKEPGSYRIVWNGTDDIGRSLARGIYFVRMTTDGSANTEKLIRVK